MNQTRRDVLNGWKEIAAYLGRDPRTVERWEKQRSLPVRRLPGSGRATVYALVAELEEWLASSPAREPVQGGSDAESPSTAQVSSADASEPANPDAETRPEETSATAHRVERRRWPWLRWTVPMTLLLLIAWVGFRAGGWRRGRVGLASAKAEVPEPFRLRTLVPSSPVPGVEELYLRGSFQTELRTPESLRRAQDAFSEAILRDPHYAPAFAGQATTYLLLREYSMLPDAEAYPRALADADKALALDAELPQAHAVKGFVDFFWRWDAVAAERQFRTALQLDPNLPLGHHWYGSVLTHEGRFREGLAELSVAQRLDPGSAAILTMRAMALGLSGERAQAADMLQEAISSEKEGQYRNPATMHSVLASLSLLPPRDIRRFLAETILAAELREDRQTAATIQMATGVYRARGEQAMWRALLEDEQRRHKTGGSTYAMARYEAELGAKDQALDDLADLFSRHDSALIGISVDPLLLGLRREPRFLQLRAAMGLPGADDN